MHYLSENRAVQHIAAKAGMHIESHSGESDAYLAVPQKLIKQMERECVFSNVVVDEPANDPVLLRAA